MGIVVLWGYRYYNGKSGRVQAEKRRTMDGGRRSAVNYTRYAVSSAEVDIASGRAEQDILFGKNVARRARFFPKREKTYHAAAGAADFHLVKHPV